MLTQYGVMPVPPHHQMMSMMPQMMHQMPPHCNMMGMMPPMPGMMPGQGQQPPATLGADTAAPTTAASVLDESTSEEEVDTRPRKQARKVKQWHQGDITSSSTFIGKIAIPRLCAMLEHIDPRYTSALTAEFDQNQSAVVLWFDPSLEYKPPSEAPHVFDAF